MCGGNKSGPGDPVALWQNLYSMIWLLVFDVVVLLLHNRPPDPAIWLHILLGVGAIGLGFSNWKGLERAKAPARLQRIARTTFYFAVAQAVFGLLMFVDVRIGLGLFPSGVIGGLHIVGSLAMITQSASVATAYDMWEEREYQENEPPARGGGEPGPAPA